MLGWQGENWKDMLPGCSILVEYLDDLLPASKTYKDCLKCPICLRTSSENKGHHACLSRFHLCQKELKCLSFLLKEEQRLADTEQPMVS